MTDWDEVEGRLDRMVVDVATEHQRAQIPVNIIAKSRSVDRGDGGAKR